MQHDVEADARAFELLFRRPLLAERHRHPCSLDVLEQPGDRLDVEVLAEAALPDAEAQQLHGVLPSEQPVEKPPEKQCLPDVGCVTNLPLPRYVSLKGSEGNARRGPGLTHRIDWVFTRAGMPLKITAEYENWRRVEDNEGAGGWVRSWGLSCSDGAVVCGCGSSSVPCAGTGEGECPGSGGAGGSPARSIIAAPGNAHE